MKSFMELSAYKQLQKHSEIMKQITMRDLFRHDGNRFDKYSFNFEEILFDFSKNIINDDTFKFLVKLAEESNLQKKIDAMFSGEKINTTENRAVLHTALRNRGTNAIRTDGKDVMPQIKAVLAHIAGFVDSVHSGKWRGCTDKKITDIVNIGIGGSDLGPAMVCYALKPFSNKDISSHFVSNVDSSDITEKLKKLNPESTLFIIASKTFTTQETLRNAKTAKEWFLKYGARNEKDIAKHFVALSTNEPAVKEFGIDPKNMFAFWNWVGGRYSLWSAIGLSIALFIGMENFEELLMGGYLMDLHFQNTKFSKNIPVIMALLGIWYNNFMDADSHAIIPYDSYLEKFPAFLQQLDMESNGKSVDREGGKIKYSTGPIIWGQVGTNAQHSFFQLIHQGTRLIPVDFLAPVINHNNVADHQNMLMSNFFAQTESLMKGKTRTEAMNELQNAGLNEEQIEKLISHKVFLGNKPTNTILYKRLTPRTLGILIALYEHKVFVQGAIWNLNSFDQWGVELGKQLANKIMPELESCDAILTHDSSTNGLIDFYKKNKNGKFSN
jgi:glucose-6-phosphate isomerase